MNLENTVVFLPGGGTLYEPNRIPNGLPAFVGLRSAEQFERETGSRLKWRIIRPGVGSTPAEYIHEGDLFELPTPDSRFHALATPESLRELVRRIREVLGGEGTSLGELLAEQQRSGSGSGLHPLLRQILAVEAAAQSPERGAPTFEIHGVMGAVRDLELFERWRNHPGFPHLIRHIVDRNEYRHAVGVLGVASALIENVRIGAALGNPSQETGRSSDLLCLAGPGHPLRIEVKAPQLVDRPRGELSRTAVRKMLQRKLAEAGTAAGGQLGPEAPGFLALVGYEMGDQNLATVEDVAAHFLTRARGRHRHVAGILTFSLDVRPVTPPRSDGHDAWTYVVEHRTSVNWDYDGPVTIVGKDRPEVLLPRRVGPEPEPPPWPEIPPPLDAPLGMAVQETPSRSDGPDAGDRRAG